MKYRYFDKKEEFLITEILQFSIGAGLQTRNVNYPIYNNQALDLKQTKRLRDDIKGFLIAYLLEFKELNEDKHLQKIIDLSNFISDKYSHILHNNRFRIGVSQKIINLFLKYLWAIEKINMPFHCPVDNIVKNKIGKIVKNRSFLDWTELDRIDEYLEYIKALKIISNELKTSIAEWELNNWQRR